MRIDAAAPNPVSLEAEGAVGGISPQEDLTRFQEMEIKPKGSREKQKETSWHPPEREGARSGELSQPLEENVRRGLGDIRMELDQRHH